MRPTKNAQREVKDLEIYKKLASYPTNLLLEIVRINGRAKLKRANGESTPYSKQSGSFK